MHQTVTPPTFPAPCESPVCENRRRSLEHAFDREDQLQQVIRTLATLIE